MKTQNPKLTTRVNDREDRVVYKRASALDVGANTITTRFFGWGRKSVWGVITAGRWMRGLTALSNAVS